MKLPKISTVLLSILVAAEATPKCTTSNEKDVVCTAGNKDYKLVKGLVSDNNATTGITLRACRIIDVEYESFNDLNALTYLDLSQNKIAALKLGVIDEPKQLTFLNLSYNLLTEFPLGLFDQTTKIERLDLKGNRINNLELGILDTLPKLSFIDLSSNALLGKDINPYIFDQSPLIKFLDFSRNNMVDAPDNLLHAFKALEILNLDRCLLKEVPQFATKPNLSTMKRLILSTNQISKLEDATLFINLDALEILDFTDNIIDHVHGNILSPLKRLQKIVFKGNRLTSIPDGLFQNMPKLITISVSGNLISDVPVNAFRGTPVKTLNMSHNKITYLVDNFCLELMNSGANLKKLFFDPNPWQCACLNDILKEVKRLGIVYNGAKYIGKAPVCATTNEFSCKRHQSTNQYYVDLYKEVVLHETIVQHS